MNYLFKAVAIAKTVPGILVELGVLLLILSYIPPMDLLFLIGLLLIAAGILLYIYNQQSKRSKRKW